MLRIGLTGGIGSGKSTVTSLLRDLGAVVTDADQIARDVVAPGEMALAAIAGEFGPEVLAADGALDRARLAALVFPDPARLRALEAITSPAIAARAAELRAAVPADAVDVYDMPLLVESGQWVHEHLTVVVDAPVEVRIARLVEQRHLDEQDARARIARQAGQDERLAAADLVIDNAGSREDTAAQVHHAWRHRLLPYQANLVAGTPAVRRAQVAIMDPDPDWRAAGARVVARLQAALGSSVVRVDHVGSTAVPGLPAKDVVDVQIGVPTLAEADRPDVDGALRRAGYLRRDDVCADTPHPAGDDPARWGKRFYRGCDPGRIVHVHIREVSGPAWRFALAFRDWLRSNDEARQRYATAKRELAASHPDADENARAKEAWFTTAYPQVLQWASATSWQPEQAGRSVGAST